MFYQNENFNLNNEIQKDKKLKRNPEINFQQFLITLSTIMRGTLDEKIKWLFNFYDLNKDGKISHDEVASMITSIYDLMGEHVNPPINENTKNEHIESVLKVYDF
jgi:Ca2+-binding EF-hand superfamily protein